MTTDDLPDDVEINEIDLIEFIAAAICINEKKCPPRPADFYGTAATWAKEHCGALVFFDAIEAAQQISWNERGAQLRRAFGGFDA